MTENVDNLITLVVHTESRASKLSEILRYHNISVVIEDVDVQDSSDKDFHAVKVRIPIDKLPLGLKILESGDLAAAPLAVMKMTGMGNKLLIPVDFSPASILSVKIGFYLANKFQVEPVILHAFLAPLFNPQSNSSLDDVSEMTEVENAVEENDIRKISSAKLLKFKNDVKALQTQNIIPNIEFSTILLEGVPEQTIQEYCREHQPMLVVMATRGINKKGEDLVGSVTAEVIDSCRVPVLSIPENFDINNLNNSKEIALFCNFTPFDTVTVRGLMKTFDYPACDISLIPVNEKISDDVDRKLLSLKKYLTDIYPTAHFKAEKIDVRDFESTLKNFIDKNKIQLIIVPNKKTSAISRFFKPTLAHKLLFEKDSLLLALPV